MKLKYTSLQSNESVNDLATDRTQRLVFSDVSGGTAPSMLGTTQLTLLLTKAEAAEYTLGWFYDLSLSVA
jgi:hypothetical protein